MKRYIIGIDGFEPHDVWAETAGKARYKDWCAAKEAGYFAGRDGFREYLRRVYTLHLGNSEDPRTDRPRNSRIGRRMTQLEQCFVDRRR